MLAQAVKILLWLRLSHVLGVNLSSAIKHPNRILQIFGLASLLPLSDLTEGIAVRRTRRGSTGYGRKCREFATWYQSWGRCKRSVWRQRIVASPWATGSVVCVLAPELELLHAALRVGCGVIAEGGAVGTMVTRVRCIRATRRNMSSRGQSNPRSCLYLGLLRSVWMSGEAAGTTV